ncbi:hypothetical protein F5B20DRAFT_581203 [Whalleya microplaca]|nr:hypothetical protein F5B20DRAFT_581203 [Whalleya microplaca]
MKFLSILKSLVGFNGFRKAKGKQAEDEGSSQPMNSKVPIVPRDGSRIRDRPVYRSHPINIPPPEQHPSSRYRREPDRYRTREQKVYPDFLLDARDSRESVAILAARGQKSDKPRRRDDFVDPLARRTRVSSSPSSNNTNTQDGCSRLTLAVNRHRNNRSIPNSQDFGVTDFPHDFRSNSFEGTTFDTPQLVNSRAFARNSELNYANPVVFNGPQEMMFDIGLTCELDDDYESASASSLECGDYEGLDFWLNNRRQSRQPDALH